MNFFKTALFCSFLCTVTPSKATYVYIDQRAVEELASKISLSTAKVILCTPITFMAGYIIGAALERMHLNETLVQIDPAFNGLVPCINNKRPLAITGAVSLALISLIASVNEQSSEGAQQFTKFMSATTIVSFAIAGLLLAMNSNTQ